MVYKAARLSFVFILILLITYLIHTKGFSSYYTESRELINFSYKFNFLFTYILLMSFVFFEKKLIHQFGYIFLAAGVLKLGLFFLGIKILNLEINKSVFLHFFVPYFVCVGVEIFYLMGVLNRPNFKNNN